MRLKELIKIKEENKTLKKCLFQVQEANKHLVKALEIRDKEVRALKSNRLNMLEHLEIVQENKKLKKALEEIIKIIEDTQLTERSNNATKNIHIERKSR